MTKMLEDDKFWHLRNAPKINSQAAFFNLLTKEKILSNRIYRPKRLSTTKNYQKYVLKDIVFDQVSFAKTSIDSLVFQSCTFNNCILIGTRINNCEFHNCIFKNTNTHKIEIANTYIDPNSFNKCLDKKKHQNIGVHLHQILLKNSQDADQIQFQKEAQFLFLRWKRYQYWYEMTQILKKNKLLSSSILFFKKGAHWLSSYLFELLLGYGLRLRHFLVTIICIIAIFSLVNYFFSERLGLMAQDGGAIDFWNALYYTVVSLTTLGYGDIVPTTRLGRILAAGQGVTGFCSFAVLASMLYRKISP